MKKGNEITERFDSIHSFLKTMDSRNKCDIMQNEDGSESCDFSFTGTKSYSEAVNLFRDGDKAAYDSVVRELMKIDDVRTTNENRSRVVNAVVGYAPNVPNAIMGLPNSMIDAKRKIVKHKVCNIQYSMSVNCNVDKKDIFKAGATLLSIINQIELKGYRVELDLIFFNAYCNKEIAKVMVLLKRYNEHIDLMKLAFPVTNPSMFRRFGFRWLETNPWIEEDYWNWGYGKAIYDDFSTDTLVYLNPMIIKKSDFDREKIIKEHFKKYVQ